jgi:hypothetical protein
MQLLHFQTIKKQGLVHKGASQIRSDVTNPRYASSVHELFTVLKFKRLYWRASRPGMTSLLDKRPWFRSRVNTCRPCISNHPSIYSDFRPPRKGGNSKSAARDLAISKIVLIKHIWRHRFCLVVCWNVSSIGYRSKMTKVCRFRCP